MLTLPIKKKWFDMIASGEKTEEYRDFTEYYKSRFKKYVKEDKFQIRFRARYRKDAPLMECVVSLFMGSGKAEWGAPPEWYGFVLKIHNVEVFKNGISNL